MGKETRQLSKEVWVCDLCGKESDYDSTVSCSSCGREICSKCQNTYFFTAERHTPVEGGFYVYCKTRREGMKAVYCLVCARRLEGELSNLGFKEFMQELTSL